MPLQPVDEPARDEGHFFSFAMASASGTVRCNVQQGALDSAEPTRTGCARDRAERFSRHRATFEAVASDLFDAGLPLRITADHMKCLRGFAARNGRRDAA